jgi:hypothetical protein
MPHYFPMCGGMASSAMELTAVLANRPQLGIVVRPVLVQERLRGW